MTKLHRPEFVKEYIKSEEDTAEKPDEIIDGESTEEKKEEMKEKAEEEETMEGENSDKKLRVQKRNVSRSRTSQVAPKRREKQARLMVINQRRGGRIVME